MSSIVISGDTSGAITLAAPSVAGTNTATLPAAAGTVMVSGNMPAFSYYSGAGTSVSTATWTKILFNTSDFDTTSGMFASSRFTPTIAGYYQISSGVLQGPFTSNNNAMAIYKNGTAWKNGSGTGVVSGYIFSNVSALVYLNGSTDYVEIYAYQSSGVSQNTFTGTSNGYFQGCLARTA